MDIFTALKKLSLPSGSFVVVGGSALVALGLMDSEDDIDLAVTPAVFAQLQSKGWDEYRFDGKTVLKHDPYDVGIGFGDWTLDDLLADAFLVNEIPFMSAEKLLVWKRRMSREKDAAHIRLLEAYLQR